ncbi:MAG: ComF family protein [Candidatus Acidiferrales bacterium]
MEYASGTVAISLASARARLRHWGGAVASILLPAPCGVCGELLDSGRRIPICGPCLEQFQPLPWHLCEHCGRPILSGFAAEISPLLCGFCRRGLYDFDFARSFATYGTVASRAVLMLKYEQVLPLGAWFAAKIAELVHANRAGFAADVVVPVPLHAARFRERGYNQAELIARPLARMLGLPLKSYLLVRTKPRPDKLKLTIRERWRTVRGAYATRDGTQVDKLRVLLVDDVFTTGATLDACSRALRKAGAVRVAGLTVARVLPPSFSRPESRTVPPGDSRSGTAAT